MADPVDDSSNDRARGSEGARPRSADDEEGASGSGAQSTLEISEERLRQAVRLGKIGIYDHDQRSDTLYWSEQQRAFFGLTADEPVSLERFLSLVHPDDLEAISAAVRRAHDPGSDGLFDVEYRAIRRDGSVRWLSNRGRTFFEGEGSARRPVRSVGAVIDLTDRRAAEEERTRLQAQLAHAQRLETVGRLAGGVAHEINNMLQVILAGAEMLQRWAPTGSGARHVTDIERAATRARDVTGQLLAFSRKQLISPTPADLNALIAEAKTGLVRLIGEDVELRFRPCDSPWTVTVDPAQVDQILMNLAINARDAMPEGGTLTIETANVRLDDDYCREHGRKKGGDYLLLTVSDSGTGMDEETLAHVFEPFFTTKAVGRGTGLGLATVYGIVDQNRGIITVHSEPGHGTTFRVYLPRCEEPPSAVVEAAEPSAGSGGAAVLLVEDDELVRRATAAALEALGYTVSTAGAPSEAIAIGARPDVAIDVLLTDVVMPEMSGKELSTRLVALRPGLRILFMSGYTSNVIAHHGVLDAEVDFISKPFGMNDLARKLREVLDVEK